MKILKIAFTAYVFTMLEINEKNQIADLNVLERQSGFQRKERKFVGMSNKDYSSDGEQSHVVLVRDTY